MSLPDWATVAQATGVTWCPCDSGTGAGFASDGKVHFKDRRVTKVGIRNFLFLVFHSRWENRRKPQWQYRHERAIWTYQEALNLGVRLDRKLFADDRSLVRFWMRDVDRSSLAAIRAWQWASRR